MKIKRHRQWYKGFIEAEKIVKNGSIDMLSCRIDELNWQCCKSKHIDGLIDYRNYYMSRIIKPYLD